MRLGWSGAQTHDRQASSLTSAEVKMRRRRKRGWELGEIRDNWLHGVLDQSGEFVRRQQVKSHI